MTSMELHIKVCEKHYLDQPKYEVYVPLGYTDEKIIEIMTEWLKDIRAIETFDKEVKS